MINAHSELQSNASATNDLGKGLINDLANKLLRDYQYTTSSGTKTLNYGDKVRVADDYAVGTGTAGTVYQYLGPEGASVNLASQDYGDFSLWKVLSPINVIPDGVVSTVMSAAGLDAGSALAIAGLVTRNDVQSDVFAKIINANVTATAGNIALTALELAGIVAFDNSVISSGGNGVSGVIVSNAVLSSALAFVDSSTVRNTTNPGTALTGGVSLTAKNQSSIDATATTSVIGSGTTVGAVIAFNTVGWKPINLAFQIVDAFLGDSILGAAQPAVTQAYITNSSVTASGAVALSAETTATINAVAGADSEQTSASTFALTAETGSNGTAAGALLASNRVNSQASAFISQTSSATSVSGGQGVAISSSDHAAITSSSSVIALSSSSSTLSDIDAILSSIVSNDYQYTTKTVSPTLQVHNGDKVRLASDYPAGSGLGGEVYEYVGTTPLLLTTSLASQSINFNLSDWKHLTGKTFASDLLTKVGNVQDLNSRAIGGLVDYNEVFGGASSYIDTATVTSSAGNISITATEQDAIEAAATSNVSSNGGSTFGAGTTLGANGQLATNVIVGGASAYVTSSTVTATAGSIALDAENTEQVDARLHSSSSTGGTSVNLTLAFNSIGWKPQNFLFNAVDTFIGDPAIAHSQNGNQVTLFNGQPADTQAYILNSNVRAGSDLTVTANGAEQVNSTVSNAATSTASGLYGQSGSGFGLILASNKVNGSAKAYIDDSGAPSAVLQVAGALTVQATDSAGIFSNSKMVSSSTTTSDGGASILQGAINNQINFDFATTSDAHNLKNLTFGQVIHLADTYDTPTYDTSLPLGDTTKSQAVVAGQTVKIAAGYNTTKGDAGAVYRYVGANATLDLAGTDYKHSSDWVKIGGANGGDYEYMGTSTTGNQLDINNQDYTDLSFWKPVLGTNLIPQGLNISNSDASAIGLMLVFNDVRGGVLAYIEKASTGNTVSPTSVTVSAEETATIKATIDSTATASGGSALGQGTTLAASGTAATNAVLSKADAYIDSSTIKTSTGAVTVLGQNTSDIEATNNSVSTSGGQAVIVTLAFNSIGWADGNILYNTVNAIAGTDIGTSTPAEVKAYITASDVEAGGALSVNALSLAQINSTLSNSATSAAAGLSGSAALSVGVVLSSNMVNAIAKAYIDNTGTTGLLISAGGALQVFAKDNSGIAATTTILATSTSTSDGAISLAANFLSQIEDNYQYTTKSGQQLVSKGELVRLANDYSGGGTAGAIYEYIGTGNNPPPATLNLGATDYSAAQWHKIVDVNSLVSHLPNIISADATAAAGSEVRNDVRSDTEANVISATVSAAGNLLVSALETATIVANDSSNVSAGGNSFTGGSSIAANITIATNLILAKANATVSGGSLTTSAGGGVTIDAENTSTIDAQVTSKTHSAGTSVGVTLAYNMIGIKPQNALFTTVDALFGTSLADEQPTTVHATGTGTPISASGSITVKALSNQTIHADVLSAAVSMSPNGGGQSIGAVITLNRMSTDVEASLSGAVAVTAAGGSIKISATDTSIIELSVLAPSIALSVSTGGSGSVSVGFGSARNTIATNVSAFTNGLTTLSATGGDIIVTAKEQATIDATGVAVAIGLNASAGSSFGVSGGGAVVTNTILGSVDAHITAGTVSATAGNGNNGDITVSATDNSHIHATVAAIAASLAVGTGTSVAAAIGLSLAFNLIGWRGITVDVTHTDGTGGTQSPVNVRARTTTSSMTASGKLGVSATFGGSIDAEVLAASLAIGASPSTGVAVGAAGLYTQNRITASTSATVDGSGGLIHVGSIAVTADDDSHITTNVAAAALALSLAGSTSVSVSIGVAVAQNTINNAVSATITGVSDLQSPGAIQVTATQDGQISATAIAAAISAGIGGSTGVALSGGGAQAQNVLTVNTTAAINNSNLGNSSNKVGAVTVAASNSSTITATVGAAAAAATVGGSAGVGFAIGAALAENDINDGSGSQGTVSAKIFGSTVYSSGAIQVTADTTAIIHATVVAAAVAIAAGGSAGVAGAGAGTSAVNNILVGTTAIIDGSGGNSVTAASVLVRAKDTATISAVVGAAAVGIAFGGAAGVAPAIGVALTSNTISGPVQASIANVASLTTTGAVQVLATDSATITSTAAAASVAAGIGGTAGVAVSGAGASATNYIGAQVEATITDSTLTSVGSVTVTADDESDIEATVGAAAAALGGGGIAGVGAAIGASIAHNTIDDGSRHPDFDTAIQGKPTALTPKFETLVFGNEVSVADGFLGTGDIGSVYRYKGAGGTIDLAHADFTTSDWQKLTGKGDVQATIENTGVTSSGALSVTATSNQTIEATVVAASVALAVGLVGVGLGGAGVETTNDVMVDTTATIDGGTTHAAITAGSLTISAGDTSSIDATAGAAAVSAAFGAVGVGVSIGIAIAHNTIDNNVAASIVNMDTGGTGKNQALVTGNTVQVSPGYDSSKGTVGTTYIYLGSPGTVDLAHANYTDRSQWLEEVVYNPTFQSSSISRLSHRGHGAAGARRRQHRAGPVGLRPDQGHRQRPLSLYRSGRFGRPRQRQLQGPRSLDIGDVGHAAIHVREPQSRLDSADGFPDAGDRQHRSGWPRLRSHQGRHRGRVPLHRLGRAGRPRERQLQGHQPLDRFGR